MAKACAYFNSLLNRRAIARARRGFAGKLSRLQPGLLGYFNLSERLFESISKSRAEAQVRDVSHVAAVLLAEEDVYVVIFHLSSCGRLVKTGWKSNLRGFELRHHHRPGFGSTARQPDFLQSVQRRRSQVSFMAVRARDDGHILDQQELFTFPEGFINEFDFRPLFTAVCAEHFPLLDWKDRDDVMLALCPKLADNYERVKCELGRAHDVFDLTGEEVALALDNLTRQDGLFNRDQRDVILPGFLSGVFRYRVTTGSNAFAHLS
jgi:hypothetical protein